MVQYSSPSVSDKLWIGVEKLRGTTDVLTGSPTGTAPKHVSTLLITEVTISTVERTDLDNRTFAVGQAIEFKMQATEIIVNKKEPLHFDWDSLRNQDGLLITTVDMVNRVPVKLQRDPAAVV